MAVQRPVCINVRLIVLTIVTLLVGPHVTSIVRVVVALFVVTRVVSGDLNG